MSCLAVHFALTEEDVVALRAIGPLVMVSIPFIVIAVFVLVAFVGWKVGRMP